MKLSYTKIDNRLFKLNKIESVINLTSIIKNKNLIKEFNLESIIKKIPKLFKGQTDVDFSVFSQAYAGHQFGNFSILGDGRAHIIKEIENNGNMFDIQLKGSGETYYSRGGDGKANLSSMIREYIMSEAMYSLGISTNRSAGVYTTGEDVFRNGDITGAIIIRLAKSHIRVGTFEYISYLQDEELLKKFTDYCIKRHYSDIVEDKNKYESFLKVIGTKQIELIIDWIRVGFIHGVMNTDNSLISGETVDYGPCAFINKYDPNKVFSSIDTSGRYSFLNQTNIVVWNLARLVETLIPLLDSDINVAIEKGNSIITDFEKEVKKLYSDMMHQKIGLIKKTAESESLIEQLLGLLEKNKIDYTNSFVSLERYLSNESYNDENINILNSWITIWQNNIEDISKSIKIMKKTNPKVIPRNHLVEKALENVGNGDMTFLNDFLEVLKNPYETPSNKMYTDCNIDDLSYQTFCGT